MKAIHLFLCTVAIATAAGLPQSENKRNAEEDEWTKWWEEMEKSMNQSYEEYVKEMEAGGTETRKKREKEAPKEPMEQFMEQMQQQFDKDFEEFMTEMEAESTTWERKKRATPYSHLVLATSGTKQYQDGVKTASLDEMFISLEQTMNDDFDEFLINLEEKKRKREATDPRAMYESWKQKEKRNAMQAMEAFWNTASREKREEERGFPDILGLITKEKKKNKAPPCYGY